MSQDTNSQEDPHSQVVESAVGYWHGSRLLLGALVVLAGAAIAAYMIQSQLGADKDPSGRQALRSTHRRTATPRTSAFNLADLTLRVEQIHRGGPPKDGIPSLTDPKTVLAKDAVALKDQDRIVAVVINGQARAYPIRILNYHECVNDQLAGKPIAIIYCPLCDSVSVLDRRIGEKVLEFGISGLLYNSNVLLYDRTDQALWTQVGFRAVSGPLVGQTLKHLDNWQVTTFGPWRKQHPDATVVSFETGHTRRYEKSPYENYFKDDALIFPVAHRDKRFKNKTPVIGIKLGDVTRAYPVATIQEAPQGVVRDKIAGHEVELRADPTTSTVQVSKVPDNAQVVHTFWFAWVAFHPKTQVYDSAGADRK